jgi:hypothetical protein
MKPFFRAAAMSIAILGSTLAWAQTEPTSAPATAPAVPATKAATKPVTKPAKQPKPAATKPVTSKPVAKPVEKPAATPAPTAVERVDGKAVLRKLVGTFDVTSKVRGTPDAPWVTLKGEEIGQLILNDRYVQSVSTLKIGDETHFYLTLTGFDPETQSFTFSSMGDDYDQMLLGTGTSDGEKLNLKTSDGKTRFAITFDDRGYAVRIYVKDEQGKEFLAGEDRYERRPAK